MYFLFLLGDTFLLSLSPSSFRSLFTAFGVLLFLLMSLLCAVPTFDPSFLLLIFQYIVTFYSFLLLIRYLLSCLDRSFLSSMALFLAQFFLSNSSFFTSSFSFPRLSWNFFLFRSLLSSLTLLPFFVSTSPSLDLFSRPFLYLAITFIPYSVFFHLLHYSSSVLSILDAIFLLSFSPLFFRSPTSSSWVFFPVNALVETSSCDCAIGSKLEVRTVNSLTYSVHLSVFAPSR